MIKVSQKTEYTFYTVMIFLGLGLFTFDEIRKSNTPHTVTVTNYGGTRVFKNVKSLIDDGRSVSFKTSRSMVITIPKECNSIIIE